ncbi:Lysophospholipase L1 [Marininema mesophilum]|uniref:Lysophospholipase L1 n=1 Tax=Marininema mesophilum TaxID=1048340 RepID=A0A1H2SIB1_9BACL|nr:GDSL-type esterase/lipase family protein [Marininema mesophilum]SDW31195.1 Lysophospholipase L1 [Marininema mesophilum]
MTTPSYLYVALGDSITEGYSAPNRQGFATQLSRRLNEHIDSFSLVNTGKKGLTSGRLASILTSSSPHAHAVSQSSLLTLNIGGNDLIHAYVKYFLFGNMSIYARTIHTYKNNLHQIYKQIRQLSHAPLYTLNQFNPFPQSRTANTWIPLLNKATAEVSSTWNVTIVDIGELFRNREPKLIHQYRTGRLTDIRFGSGSYPVHPNRLGHQVITDALWETIIGQKNSRTG